MVEEKAPGTNTEDKENPYNTNNTKVEKYFKFLLREGAFLVPLPPYPVVKGKEPNAPLVKWSELTEKPTWNDIKEASFLVNQKIPSQLAVNQNSRDFM
jgi:hypothetical protein